MPPFWYNLLLALILPLYRLRVWQRSRHQPDYQAEVSQRFGRFAPARQTGVVWIHAVSVGETNAAQPIIQHLLDQGHAVLVTNTTRTGQARVRQLFAERVESVFLPVDTVGLMADFFEQHQPHIIGLIETELWPNLIQIAAQRKIPTILLNARLSEKSAKGYAKFASLTRPMLQQLTCIAAQDQATAERFMVLGADAKRVVVTGSLKFDLQPPEPALQQAELLRTTWSLSGRKIIVAASTHEPEENQILNIFKALHQRYPNTCLIIVPRHPERFDRVAALIEEKGWTLARRSAGQVIEADTAVYLADSMGELWIWYALADMAFVGGSLAATGGHNPLEPARLAVPVVMGSQTFNFAQIVQSLVDAGGLVQVEDVSGVYATFAAWCEQPAQAKQIGQNGRNMLDANQGALARQLGLLDALMSS
ncbi:MAG: lipid IV(A) 3-deoxy-D-manno-octulosonic acid transferase [Pseudomonadota bacterium]|nr:lipid IV(A) 3-deoxy-D-manno-octulosonic acid transferase [Pseudomonadota bacterium]